MDERSKRCLVERARKCLVEFEKLDLQDAVNMYRVFDMACPICKAVADGMVDPNDRTEDWISPLEIAIKHKLLERELIPRKSIRKENENV